MTIVHLGTNRYQGLTADTKPTNVPSGSIYRDTQLDIIYEYNGSSWDIMMGNTKTETYTGKTVDSINNTLKNIGNHIYEVFTDGSLWYARNTKTGVITSTNASLTTVLQAAINALTSSRTIIETVKVRGVGITDTITLPSYTKLDLTDAQLTLLTHTNPTNVSHMFVNSDTSGGNTQIQIVGGRIDGNKSNQYPYSVSPPGDEDTANIFQFTKVTNPQVIGVSIKNSCARQIRFKECIDGIMAHNISDTANAEAFQTKDGSGHSIFFNTITNSYASWITTFATPNCIIHGNHGRDNTGAFSGYNVSSSNTTFTNNIGSNAGSTVLTMSEATADNGSFSLISGNDLSYSRAAEGMTMIGGARKGVIITKNRFHHNFKHGVRVGATQVAIQIEGNLAWENNMSGIAVNSGTVLIPDQISIKNNHCWDNGIGASSNDYERSGIAVYKTGSDSPINVTITGNHCFDTNAVVGNKTQFYGIYALSILDSTIFLNHVVNNKTDGILLGGTNTNLRIFENRGYSLNTPLATTTGTETWTNKTLTSPTIATIINGGGTLTLPNITTSLVGRTTVDTLTNKTHTSPVINSASIDGTITIPSAVSTPLLFEKTAASGADSIVQFKVSDDASSFMSITNGTGTDAIFSPQFNSTQSSTFPAITYVCQGTTDTGTNPIFLLTARIGASTAVATRPLLAINNVNTGGRIMQWNPTNLQFLEAYDMVFGTTTGTKIGTATTQKIGFWNKTPVVQPATIAATDTSTVDATYGSQEAAVINDLRTKFDDLVTKLKAVGLIA